MDETLNEGTEAEYLSDQFDGFVIGATEFAKDINDEMRSNSLVYVFNKKAKTGTELVCPTCRRKFIKNSYQQAFCSQPGQKKRKCKDKYWNRIKFWNDEGKVEALLEKIDEMKYGLPYETFEDN